MDEAAQIKKNLISRIKASKNLDFLKVLQTIFDSSEQSLYELSEEQQNSIELSRNEIRKGEYLENDQVISELKEWLTEK